MGSVILEIQAEATSSRPDTTVLLRKAKLAATKLNDHQAVQWIACETDGYTCPADELPPYRKLYGELRAWNPYNGFIPLETRNVEIAKLLKFAPVFQGIASIEENIRSTTDGDLIQYTLSDKKKKWLYDNMDLPLEPVLQLHSGQLVGLVSAVVSKILDWALELERAGVLGEGMSFTMNEKKTAAPINQYFFGSNIGQVGSMQDHSTVHVGSQSSSQVVDQRALQCFIDDAQRASILLPPAVQATVVQHLEALRQEKSDSAQRSLLSSLRNVLEGAAGGVVAQGMISSISAILG